MADTVPLLVALGLLVLYGLGVLGYVLTRDPRSIEERFEHELTVDQRGRASVDPPLTRAYKALQAGLAPAVLELLGPERVARTQHTIDAAGRPQGVTVEGYAGRKATLTLVLLAVALLVVVVGGLPPWLLGLPVLGWFLVDISLRQQATERQEEIERELPDFLDVLAVTVSAGMSFRPALARVADAFPGPLGDEVATALRQMSLGMGRRAALTGMRERNDSEQLAEFVTALLQAEELGAPLTETLRDIARDLRRAWEQNARRTAARTEPRISVIVTTTIVPAAAILILVGLFTTSDLDLGSLLGG